MTSKAGDRRPRTLARAALPAVARDAVARDAVTRGAAERVPPLTRALLGAAAAAVLQRLALRRPPGGTAVWERTNHRGVPVSRVAGPVLALGATVASPLPAASAAVAGLGAGVVGLYDDLRGTAHAKGFRGHLGALRRGEVTSGVVKVAGVGAAGLVASALLRRRPVLDVVLDGAVVAGAANLLNLLDLRPGRALKSGVGAALLTGQPGLATVGAVLLPSDLGERTMLGDAGANAYGALLGLGWVAATPDRGRRLRGLLVLVGLTAASEAVSFSRVIDAVPPLRVLDRVGRLP